MAELQLVVRRKPRLTIYLRESPSTITYPKDAQIDTRLAFSRAAKKAKGKKGLAPDGLPWAAHYVKEELKGRRSPYRYRRKPKWMLRIEALREAVRLVRAVATVT